MKKKVFILLTFLSVVNPSFSQEIKWKVKDNTQLILYNDKGVVDLPKDEVVLSSKLTGIDDETNLIGYIYYKDYKGEIDADTLIPNNSTELFATDILNKNIITLPYYNFDILSKNDRTLFKQKFENAFYILSGEYYTKQDSYEYFIEHSSKSQLAIRNPIIIIDANNEQCCVFFVEQIHKISDGYKCEGYMQVYYNGDIFFMNPTNGRHTLLIIYDGDYINVYEDSKDKLLMTYAMTDENTLKEFNNLIKTGSCDLSKVTWPRHADGTCNYDKENKPAKFNFADIKVTPVISEQKNETKKQAQPTIATNVAPNKTMTVKENLKLRSGEATSTQVLTVMQAGTKVKILELGKAEKIDGINSNWV